MSQFGYKKMYTAGALRDAAQGAKHKIVCPATEEVVAELAWASREDALMTLEAAQKGFEYWSKLPLATRKEWMLKLRTAVLEREEELRLAMMAEMGKTYESAWEDIEALVNGLEFYPEAMKQMHDEIIPDAEGTHTHQIVNRPVGVVVAYLAWNFPILNCGYKIGPALAAGCSLIIRPSELAPLSGYILGEIIDSINFPAGVINIICGPVGEVADALTKSTTTRLITMIGSTGTARRVIADSTTSIKRVSMELGGNAPFIVFEDADIDLAVELGIALKYGNCGQVCVAPNRFLIHENVMDEFLEKFTAKAKALRIGYGREEQPQMGPCVDKRNRERVMKMVQDDVAAGATLVYGGEIPADKPIGSYMMPTIITGLTPEMRCFREEVFGPVAAMMTFQTEDEAMELANDTEYGLASYIFAKDERTIRRFSEDLAFGEVQVNGVKYAIYLPHIGVKQSGIGCDCSYMALHDYIEKKRITTARISK